MTYKKKYYLYIHTRLDKNEVFYVGIGTNRGYGNLITSHERAFSKYDRNGYWKNIVNLNKNYKISIIFETNSRAEIENKEIELIKFYGRKDLKTGILCNLTNGGEGIKEVSKEGRLKISIASKKYCKNNKEERTKQRRLKQGVPLVVLDLNNNILYNTNSLGEATDFTGVNKQQINNVLCNKNKSAHGFVFVRKVEYDKNKNYTVFRENGLYLQSKIVMMDMKENVLKQFSSTREAFLFLGKKQGTAISNCLNKKSKKAYGYKWKYEETFRAGL